jgi:hypothetical protein
MTTDKIEPALSAKWWDRVRHLKARGDLERALLATGTEEIGLVGVIAAANAALPDSDPRKITREWLSALEEVIGAAALWNSEQRAAGRDMQAGEHALSLVADLFYALESYLPPPPPYADHYLTASVTLT